MARIFLLRVGTKLDFETVNLQVRELGFSSDSEELFLGTSRGNVKVPLIEDVARMITDTLDNVDSAYDVWIKEGNTGTEADFLASLTGADGADGVNGADGGDGKSTYQVWLDLGNTGTEADFLDSLAGADGADGKSAYQEWLDDGNVGTEEDFLDDMMGADGNAGESAYQTWLNLGNEGTEQDFIDSLGGGGGGGGGGATPVAVAAEELALNYQWCYSIGSFPYNGEVSIPFSMTEFSNYHEGGDGEINELFAPLQFSGILYIPENLTIPYSEEEIAFELELHPNESPTERLYYCVLDDSGEMSVYIASANNSDLDTAIITISEPIETSVGHTSLYTSTD